MLDKSVHDIMKMWKDNQSDPVVSICCVTYNHEKYIMETLDSFLSQKTDFSFEIVIDDDCSQDGTVSVIERYAEAYPNIIKLNARKRNVGPMSNSLGNLSRAKGKFIAYCDGDDYWTDPLKLQKQIDAMRCYPNCKISCHASEHLFPNGNTILWRFHEENKLLSVHDMIRADIHLCATASIVLKSEVLPYFNTTWFREAPVGDFFMRAIAAMDGGLLYLKDCMTVYRIAREGSWTVQVNNTEHQLFFMKRFFNSLDALDQNVNGQLSEDIKELKLRFTLILFTSPHIGRKDKQSFFNQYCRGLRYEWLLRLLSYDMKACILTYRALCALKRKLLSHLQIPTKSP